MSVCHLRGGLPAPSDTLYLVGPPDAVQQRLQRQVVPADFGNHLPAVHDAMYVILWSATGLTGRDWFWLFLAV